MNRDTRNLLLGAGIGAAVVLAAPLVAPVIAAALRPLLKTGIKQGLLATEVARERLALLLEHAQDLLAEAQAEARESSEERRATVAGAPLEAPASPGRPSEGRAKPVGQA